MKHLKRKLVLAFSAAVLTVAAAAGIAFNYFSSDDLDGGYGKRGLTDGEKAAVTSFFGAAVNADKISIINGANCYPKEGITPVMEVSPLHRTTIQVCKGYEDAYASDDYSKISADDRQSLVRFGAFMHEVGHIWQFSRPEHIWDAEEVNGVWTAQRVRDVDLREAFEPFCIVYKYRLNASSNFDDYCMEQQAAIIEDYARWFLHPAHRPRRIEVTPENRDWLQHVVETKFPSAREARLEFEKMERRGDIVPPISAWLRSPRV